MWSGVAKLTIRVLQYLVVILIWPHSRLLSLLHKKKAVPPLKNPILLRSATQLARQIRNREVSCHDVVRAYIERIKEVDPIVNSVVEDRFDTALSEALEVDEMIKQNPEAEYWRKEKPLLGVPVTIKESIAVSGMSQNGGRIRPRERQATKDSEAVANLKSAGAVILAVTNTPEFCLFWETYNNAHGITRNPFDTARTAGGSSGGECALISAGGSVIGLGSDIVGSGRIPALFCGIFGHKPTPRLISVEGHLPVSEDKDWSTFLVISPLCRYAEDFPLLLSCSAPTTTKDLHLHDEVNISKLKVFYLEEHKSILHHSVDPELKEAVRKAADHFRTQYNINVKRVDFKEFGDTLEAASTLMLRMRSPQVVFQKTDDPEDWGWKEALSELGKKLIGLSPHTLYSIVFGIIKKLADLQPKSRVEEIVLLKQNWQMKFKNLLGENGVMILPIFPHTASYHYQMYYKLTNIAYMSAFNFLEMPATACPMGLSKKGLPLGIQVVAWKNQDRLTFAVAKELELNFGGWVTPSKELQSTEV